MAEIIEKAEEDFESESLFSETRRDSIYSEFHHDQEGEEETEDQLDPCDCQKCYY